MRGGRAEGRRMGGKWADAQMAHRIEADRPTGGRADRQIKADKARIGSTSEWVDRRTGGRADRQIKADEAQIGPTSEWANGQTGGRAGGLKDPTSHSPLHSLVPRLLASQ